MGDSTQWVKHIELYVNSSSTPSQQAASVDAIATLVKNDMLTLEALVRGMGMYLTSTDSIIRSRGILLLAELLSQLSIKPFGDSILHSLMGFFTERLADWKALRGAIVGCLALLRRKIDVGVLTNIEVKAVAESYLKNIPVQSLGQHDRKLSFQLMECLLSRHADAVRDLGDELFDVICEAIDGEKDPQCLLLVFHIVESLAHLYPGPSGPLANFAGDLFEILGCYFPIHFTHQKAEDDGVKREELSTSLMIALASTPFFEPFSIPLLLEKLSSSLPSTKVESFRYLSYCTAKYGPDRMAKHAPALWASVKDAIYTSPHSTFLMDSESNGGMNFQYSDIMTQAYILLQEVIRQDGGFISLILDDNDINVFLNSLDQYEDFDDIPVQVKQRLHAVGHIFMVCAKSSISLCNKVFEKLFPLLMDALGISVTIPSKSSYLDEDCFSSVKFNFGALYLCTELLAACRYLTTSLNDCTLIPDLSHQTWCSILTSFSKSLLKTFIFLSRSNIADKSHSTYVYFGVKGLQILATFPGSFLPVSKFIYDKILLELVSVVISHTKKTLSWTLALKALVEITLLNDKIPDSEKAASFESIVVEKIVSLISCDDSAMLSSLKLQAAFDIGATRKFFMLKVTERLDEAISTNLSAVYDHGNLESHELLVNILDNYSNKIFPWFLKVGGSEEIPLNFALSIWDKIGNAKSFSLSSPEIASDLLGATIDAMKKAVATCSVKSQEIIVNKAFGVLLSSKILRMEDSEACSFILKAEGLQKTYKFANSSSRDEWVTSLFASVVISLRPQTSIPQGKLILQLFITNLLNGHAPSAHALGSMVNKLHLKDPGLNFSNNFSLDEALDMIFHSLVGSSCADFTTANAGINIDFSSFRLHTIEIQSVKLNTINALAWIGKGLLMRGHEKVKGITMALLSFLTLDSNAGVSRQVLDVKEFFYDDNMHQLMKCLGDAFQIIMSDSESCLNRTYHATVRPLYKQRFFSIITPILLSLTVNSELSVRYMLYRALAHVVSNTPLTAILGEAKKLVPVLLDCLKMLSKDVLSKEIVYDILLIISGILVHKTGQEVAADNAPGIVNQLIELTAHSHVMAIRETAIQCLVAMSELPYTRIYPLRTQVLRAVSKALDDPKRIVRQEAVRCAQAWASTSSRSLQF